MRKLAPWLLSAVFLAPAWAQDKGWSDKWAEIRAAAKIEGTVGEEFELELVVPAGRTVRIETSSDLVRWVPWKEVTGTGETLWLPDPESKKHARRFYRVVSP